MAGITASVLGYWGESAAVGQDVGARPSDCADPNDPPAFLTHGTADPTVDISYAYAFADSLRAHGIASTLIPVENGPHMIGRNCMWQEWSRLTPATQAAMGTEANFLAYKDSLRTGLHEFITGILGSMAVPSSAQPHRRMRSTMGSFLAYDLRGRSAAIWSAAPGVWTLRPACDGSPAVRMHVIAK